MKILDDSPEFAHAQLLLVHDPQVLHAILLPTLQELIEHLDLLGSLRNDERPGELEAEVELAVELREHLVAPPAVLGLRGARHVIVPGVHNARVTFCRTLCDIIRSFQ